MGGGVTAGPITQGPVKKAKKKPPPYPGFLSPEEQLALATKQAEALLKPYLDQLRATQERQTRLGMAKQAGLAKLYDALGGALTGVGGQIGDIYAGAAGNLGGGFDTGYTHGWQIAQQGLRGQGAGFATSAGALPAIAGQQGGVKFLTAAQEAEENDAKLADLVNSTAAQIPAKAQEFLADIQQSQAQLASSYASYQSKQAAEADKAGEKDRAYAWSVADRFTKSSDHFYVAAQDPKTGRWRVVDAGPKSQQAGKAPTTRTVNGVTQQWDAATGTWIAPPGGAPPKKPAAKEPKAPTTKMVNGKLMQWDPASKTWIPAPGNIPTKPAAAAKKPAPTQNQINDMVRSWYTGKPMFENVQAKNKKGKPAFNKQGNPVFVRKRTGTTGKFSYQQAYRRLRALNITDQQARAVLDTQYQRGERGRPWVSARQRAVLKKAGLSPKAKYDHGVAYLTPAQAEALKAAGVLPPGEKHPANGIKDKGFSLVWVYVISPGY